MESGSSKLMKLRTGIPPHRIVTVGEVDKITVAVVILKADVTLQIEEMTQQYYMQNKDKVNDAARAQFYNAALASFCMRNPNDLNERLATSVDEVLSNLDLEDIARITDAYSTLMLDKAPKLELLNQEQIDTIKKHLEVTPLSDLSTVLLVHLANCHQTIVSGR